ncbi:MAG: ABC transporter permease [Bacteroidia bacterium]|nr:ABC transporter permease [Bacteroidia bacterium]
MLKNYFKIAWRNIWNNKLFSVINIVGLAIGIACCTVIFLYVNNELSYDHYHTKANRLFRLTTIVHQPKKNDHFAPSSPITAAKLKQQFPEIENIVRLNESKRNISYKGKHFYENDMLYADSALLDMFSYEVIEGNPKKALSSPYSIVLTESAAKKYFGNEPAFGKMLQFSDTINLMVTGIIKDMPQNSHFHCESFLSRSTMNDMNKNNEDWNLNNENNWFNCNSYSYILLKENVDYLKLQSKMNAFIEKEMAELKKQYGMDLNVELQKITDIHLKSHLDAEMKDEVNGDITYVYIFIGAALLTLLIACCNFINLSTTRSLNRSKEIGLRKVIGARRPQLIAQFLGESMLFSLIACVLSFLMVLVMKPAFNSFVGTSLTFNAGIFWLYLIIIIGIGILAGLYPAVLMSSFSPIQSLKGKVSHGISDIIFRKGLVIFQFSIAIILIVGTTLILQQLNFIQSRNIGLKKEQVLTLELAASDAPKADLLLKELLKNPKVVNGSLNSFSFKGTSNITALPEGAAQNEMTASYVICADENFLKTYQIALTAGRDFSKSFATDATEAFLVNEAAVKSFNWKNPKNALGKKIEWGGLKNGKVIGVVKDFNFASLHENIKPLIIHVYPGWCNKISLRLKTDNLPATMIEIENSWKSIATQSAYKYHFMEDEFNNQYRSEQNMKTVLSAFTFLSILVACLGLFGLASFTIKQKVKEIGIRKVLGSSVSGIVQLLSKDFLKLVIISFIIGAPVAWYGMNKWLQDYAYRIEIKFWVFALAGLLAFLIAFLTVSIQAFKAALSNPVKSLRTE